MTSHTDVEFYFDSNFGVAFADAFLFLERRCWASSKARRFVLEAQAQGFPTIVTGKAGVGIQRLAGVSLQQVAWLSNWAVLVCQKA